MDGFSDRQLEQLRDLLTPITTRLDDLDRQQGDIWETSIRQAVQAQFGHSFSKEYSVTSLQHLAKLVCRSTGWSCGTDAVDICRVSEKLATRVLDGRGAERLLQAIFTALTESAGSDNQFVQIGAKLLANPWFDSDGHLDLVALGRCLPAFEQQMQMKHKLEKLYRLLSSNRPGSIAQSFGASACHDLVNSSFGSELVGFRQVHARQVCELVAKATGSLHFTPLISGCGCSGQVQHLLNCHSAGVLLALYEAQPSDYHVERATSFEQLAEWLPFFQVQMDVRGKYTIIKNQVTIEVGEIKRNVKKYSEAKKQLIKRAKLIQWAISMAVDKPLEFVLIGHLFVPRSKPDADIPGNEITDSVSIFVHKM